MKKHFAIKVFYIAMAASIAWAALQAVIYSQTGSFLLMAQIPMLLIRNELVSIRLAPNDGIHSRCCENYQF